MPVKSPKQIVTERFGTREDLVKQILPLLGESGDTVKSSLMGSTNKKLLRIHKVASDVSTKFGGKGGLIDAIGKLQFSGRAPNAGWREKMEGYTVKRLFDHHRHLASKAS